MSANIDRVEHAITESLNGMQLGEKCVVQTELNELKQLDPRHWHENIRLFAKMTSNYAGFPHLEIENAANSPEAPIKCPPAERDCHVQAQAPTAPQPRYDAPPAPIQREYAPPPPVPAPAEIPQAPPQPPYIPQRQPDYIAPPPMQAAPEVPQAQYLPPPPQQWGAPPQPNLATTILGDLALGLGVGAAAVLGGGRDWRHRGYGGVNYLPFAPAYNDYGAGAGDNAYPIYPQPAPLIIYPHRHRR